MKPVKAAYAFSGNPITFGHIPVIERASKLFDNLVVDIGLKPAKKYLSTLEEQLEMAMQALSRYKNIEVLVFRGLLLDYVMACSLSLKTLGRRTKKPLANRFGKWPAIFPA
jgi:cytidyltransferase-like protein